MSERCAVVTGAGGGIGSAVVRVLLGSGWSVIGVDRVERPQTLPPTSGLRWVVGDVRDDATLEAALVGTGGTGVTGLVTATIAEDRDRLERLDRARLAAVYDAQVATAWEWSRAVADAAPADGASVVHVSSVHAVRAAAGMAAYAMSKAALGGLVRASALEWGARRVRCNAVLPGFVPVDRNAHRWSDPDAAAVLREHHPLGRFVTPEDVAHAVAFLLGPQAHNITGVALPVDGGMLAMLPEWA
jgi:NAD(P)-dependent dehydrogenase (short-subunit alcohol dehydrogenase family)